MFAPGRFKLNGDGFVTISEPVAPSPDARAVPEPATWAMMIGGFDLIGGAMRRRRQKAAVIQA